MTLCLHRETVILLALGRMTNILTNTVNDCCKLSKNDRQIYKKTTWSFKINCCKSDVLIVLSYEGYFTQTTTEV